MAKLGLMLILVGVGSLILKFMGYSLKFEDFMGASQPWIMLGAAAVGVVLVFAGFMTER